MQQQPRRWPGFDKCVETKLRWDVYIRPWPPGWSFLRRIYTSRGSEWVNLLWFPLLGKRDHWSLVLKSMLMCLRLPESHVIRSSSFGGRLPQTAVLDLRDRNVCTKPGLHTEFLKRKSKFHDLSVFRWSWRKNTKRPSYIVVGLLHGWWLVPRIEVWRRKGIRWSG